MNFILMASKSLITLHIFQKDISPWDAWRLLDWCRSKGANEFTFSFIYGESDKDAMEKRWSKISKSLEKDYLGEPKRGVLSFREGKRIVKNKMLWKLNKESINVLYKIFEGFLFTYWMDKFWPEDPIFYRNSEIMLGIVTHESEGVIRVYPEEVEELKSLGIVIRDKGEYVS